MVETRIHPTAIVEDGAELDEGVTVEAYAFVSNHVQLGRGCRVRHHATVEGRCIMGVENEVYPYAYIGAPTQDMKYEGGLPTLHIGDRNLFREYVTIHRATSEETQTRIGSDNVFLAYSHVAHECVVGNHLTMSSHAALGGHVHLGDWVNIGWSAGVHQFCRIGDHAMIGACSKVVQDVIPFVIADGNPVEIRAINKVGLERRGFSEDDIMQVRELFRILYRDGLNRSQAMEKLEPMRSHKLVGRVLDFVGSSERGLC